MNQIFTAITAFFVLVSGIIGFTPDPFEKEISDNVKVIDDTVQNVRNAYGIEDSAHFRSGVQDAQIVVTRMWWNSQRDTSIPPEHVELNKKYQSYVAEAGTILDIYNRGGSPESADWDRYENAKKAVK